MTCAVAGCEREPFATGLCTTHYFRQRRGAPMDGPVQKKRARPEGASAPGGPCGAQGCDQPAVGMGLCWRHYRRGRAYGLDHLAVDALLASQGGRCALCGGAEPRNALGWMVDHDHTTGRVRGILCHPCNIGLGMLGDTSERLEAAIRYLRRTEAA